MKIGAVVLAAGGSTRLGSPKQLLQFRGESFLRHAVRTALAAGFLPVVVVLGREAQRLGREVSDLPVTIAHNPAWAEGMGSSLAAGMRALAAAAPEAVLVTLCDQPLVGAAALAALAGAFAEGGSDAAIAASGYGGGAGAPAIFGRAHFAALVAMEGDRGARGLLRQHAERVITVPLPAGATDIDTREQYERLAGGEQGGVLDV